MNALFKLLGLQGASQAPQESNIEVVGKRQSDVLPTGADYDDYILNNTEAVRNRQADLEQTEEASERKGMFGVKGTLRDILGLVGDAFLVQGGRNPIYAPQRERERISDAGAGFTEDPVAAAERVGYYDLDAGLEMFDKYRANELKTAQQEDLAANRSSQIETRRAGLIEKGRKAIQGVLAQSGAYDAEGNLTPDARAVMERMARQSGATLEELVGEELTGPQARLYGAAGINPYQQERLEDADRAGDQRDYSNQTSRISATRPRATPRPRAESDREVAIAIGNKPESERTPGEQAFYEKYTRPPASATKGRRQVPGASRFRPASN